MASDPLVEAFMKALSTSCETRRVSSKTNPFSALENAIAGRNEEADWLADALKGPHKQDDLGATLRALNDTSRSGRHGAISPFNCAISGETAEGDIFGSGPPRFGGFYRRPTLLDALQGSSRSSPKTALAKVRRVFFSFHYQRDIWRVQQVRNHWMTKPDREAAGYFDGSLSEKAKTEGRAEVKRLIDKGLNGSSVTCVLIGTETFQRYWVDYEIFRSVELGKGVFGVRIHNLENEDGYTNPTGPNPFAYLICASGLDGKMAPYVDYGTTRKVHPDANSVSPSRAKYLVAGTSPRLSELFRVYDWRADDGYNNFSSWVDTAARQAGR